MKMKLLVFTYKLEIFVACWLALLQEWTRAYTIESMSAACAQGFGSRKQIRLSAGGSYSAASLLFDVAGRGVEPRSCGIDVHVPNTHVISLHLMGTVPGGVDSQETSNEMYPSPCPLAVFSLAKGGRTPRRHLRSVDMCDADAVFEFSTVFSRQHISLVWMPPSGNFSHRLQATEIVVTAVGSGPAVCKTTHQYVQFPCWRHTWYSSYCVAGELVCDGKPNCPEGGGDEDPQLCATFGAIHSSRAPPVDARRNRVKEVPGVVKEQPDVNATSNTNILVNLTSVASGGSFPAALSQYGPWGFVMLGMLICGSVLMVCGLWECCCRRSKTPNVATTTPPTVFVTNSSGQTEELPSAPPSYDDLDQPPAYSSLFPTLTSKSQVETNVHQISDGEANCSARH